MPDGPASWIRPPDRTFLVTADNAPVGLPPRKLYKIGEVMQYSGVSRQTLHNYTVYGLITEAERTPSGHRLYDEEVFHRLQRIGELKKKLKLREIRKVLDEE